MDINTENRTERPGRKARVTLIMGGNGCGKSTFAVNLMKNAIESGAASRGLMVLPTFDDWAEIIPEVSGLDRHSLSFEGIKHNVYNNDDDFKHIFKNYHNGILTLDDCRTYVPSNFDNSYLKKILQRRRQMMVDVVLMAHGFREVPPKLFTFVTHYIIFNVTDNPAYRKADIPEEHFDNIQKIVHRVRKKAAKNAHYCEPYTVVPD